MLHLVWTEINNQPMYSEAMNPTSQGATAGVEEIAAQLAQLSPDELVAFIEAFDSALQEYQDAGLKELITVAGGRRSQQEEEDDEEEEPVAAQRSGRVVMR